MPRTAPGKEWATADATTTAAAPPQQGRQGEAGAAAVMVHHLRDRYGEDRRADHGRRHGDPAQGIAAESRGEQRVPTEIPMATPTPPRTCAIARPATVRLRIVRTSTVESCRYRPMNRPTISFMISVEPP